MRAVNRTENLAPRTCLVGKTLTLQKFSESDITDSYLGWLRDRELMKFSQQSGRVHTKESCLQYLDSFRDSPNHFWSVKRVDSNQAIGTLTIYVDTENQIADIGILIGDLSIRGTGAGSEAWGLAIEFCFTDLGLRKVTGGTVKPNLAMRRVFEKHRMLLEAELRQELVLQGQPTDVIRFGILREEWEAIRSGL